jgi:hypothetical protein
VVIDLQHRSCLVVAEEEFADSSVGNTEVAALIVEVDIHFVGTLAVLLVDILRLDNLLREIAVVAGADSDSVG